jgi:hypothetical protein
VTKPEASRVAICLIFAAQLKGEHRRGRGDAMWSHIGIMAGPVLPEARLHRHMFPPLHSFSEAQKARRKGEDKINDCGNLSKNTSNDFKCSINTSMAFFFFRKKKRERKKGVEGKIRMFMLTSLFTYVWFSAALARSRKGNIFMLN